MGFWSLDHFSWVDQGSLSLFSDFLPFYLAYLSLAHYSYREMCIFVCLCHKCSYEFSSSFIRSLVEVYRSSSSAYTLFFPVFIHWILLHLGLEEFPASEPIHIIALIGATFLRQRATQIRASSKRPRVKSSSGVPPPPPPFRWFDCRCVCWSDCCCWSSTFYFGWFEHSLYVGHCYDCSGDSWSAFGGRAHGASGVACKVREF